MPSSLMIDKLYQPVLMKRIISKSHIKMVNEPRLFI